MQAIVNFFPVQMLDFEAASERKRDRNSRPGKRSTKPTISRQRGCGFSVLRVHTPVPEEVRQGQKVNELVFRYRLQEWFLAILLAIFELGDIDLLLYPPTIAH